MFWVDLSAMKMIDGGFTTASANTVPSGTVTGTAISAYLPAAKIGNGNYVYVWSNGAYQSGGAGGSNFFGISSISRLNGPSVNLPVATPTLTVSQTYAIDTKTDDGLPQSGRVLAIYASDASGGVCWANGSCYATAQAPPYTTATAGTSSTCFDNGGVTGTMQYSITQNGGAGSNCALSFTFQGAGR